ncbi:leucyl aminopeptidase [Vallitalea okinawensis]|uniref:leucyl aminopeptidase n=1 Tax=Vallitalea okinawensis TaxID=2078660 RepID=UPI0013003565|nr:leucyl aminopeptidase [Vallitalea okinawensis]
MKLKLHRDFITSEAVLVPVFKGKLKTEIPEGIRKEVEYLIEEQKRTEKKVSALHLMEGAVKLLVLVDFGEESKLDVEEVRRRSGEGLKPLKEKFINNVTVLYTEQATLSNKSFYQGITEGLMLASYSFNNYKSKGKDYTLEEIMYALVPEVDIEELSDQAEESDILVEATFIARDLVNEPANKLYPKTLAKIVEDLGEEHGFETEIFKKEEIEKLGMEAFLEVAKGSKRGPRLIVMRYYGAGENEKILGLVGKGLTYDAGGYSIKPTTGMVNMKTDMGGSAAVIGAMVAITKAKLPVNVVAIVAACENMISGKAYKPGDIIGSMGGKTILVENTDAEGRLTLIDAVHYAKEIENVNEIVDIATLTGSQAISLGTERAGVISNNDHFYGRVDQASKKSGEKIWRLPHDEAYKKQLDSPIADLRNIGGREAGTITAGLFIGAFVGDTPWAHIDIAAPSAVEKAKHYYTKGATGFGARMLYEVAKLG